MVSNQKVNSKLLNTYTLFLLICIFFTFLQRETMMWLQKAKSHFSTLYLTSSFRWSFFNWHLCRVTLDSPNIELLTYSNNFIATMCRPITTHSFEKNYRKLINRQSKSFQITIFSPSSLSKPNTKQHSIHAAKIALKTSNSFNVQLVNDDVETLVDR